MPSTRRSYLDILVVSDDENVRGLLKTTLMNAGFRVEVIHQETVLYDTLLRGQTPYDIVIVDMKLPKIDGLSICKQLRQVEDGVRIILLTPEEDAFYGIVGLEMGADYYMLKPISSPELVARVKAIQRRVQRVALENSQGRARDLRLGVIRLDHHSNEIIVGDTVICLTKRETELLAYLIQHPNQVISRDDIFHVVWRDEPRDLRIVDKLVSLLRLKLNTAPFAKVSLRTVRGRGYLLQIGET